MITYHKYHLCLLSSNQKLDNKKAWADILPLFHDNKLVEDMIKLYIIKECLPSN